MTFYNSWWKFQRVIELLGWAVSANDHEKINTFICLINTFPKKWPHNIIHILRQSSISKIRLKEYFNNWKNYWTPCSTLKENSEDFKQYFVPENKKRLKFFRPKAFTLSRFLIHFRLDLSLRILKEVEMQWFEKFKILESTGKMSSKRRMKFPPVLLQYGKGLKNKKRFLVPSGHRDL